MENWCIKQRLLVNPQKTEMMLFTRKRTVPEIRLPRLFNTQLTLSDSVKYLGVVFDPKLSFAQHVEQRVRKATFILCQCRRTFSRTWGLTPKMVNWIYTSVVRPYLAYGVIAWWSRVQLEVSRKMLSKVQRLACVSITGVMRTTPTAALEVLLDLPPLHIFLEGEVTRSLCRVSLVLKRRVDYCEGTIRGSKIQRFINCITQDLGRQTDTMVPELTFGRNYGCYVPERTEWDREIKNWIDNGSIEFYTDGSLIDEVAGSGIYEETMEVEQSIPLGRKTTVFQAEIYAIYTAANLALQKRWTNQSIYFHTDSQAAIGALKSGYISSHLIEICVQKLDRLGRSNKVTVDWVPGHSGIPGNEKADSLARAAVEIPRNGDPRVINWSYSLLKDRLSKRLKILHTQYWNDRVDCRQTKLFVAGPSSNRTKFLLSLKRQDLRAVIGIITGHCTLNGHMKTIGAVDSPTCPGCLEEDETAEHFVCFCPAFSESRNRTIGGYMMNSSELCEIDLKSVLSFIKRTGRFRDLN